MFLSCSIRRGSRSSGSTGRGEDQRIQDIAGSGWVWRIDDDEIPEPNVLERLFDAAIWQGSDIGAVGGLVLPPNPQYLPQNAANLISDLNLPNIQWFRHPGVRLINVEHLHSTFLYRYGVAKYDPFLSPAAHREETLFTHEILRKGFRLIVDSGAITWHFRSQTGGIRSHTNVKFWEDDEKLFNSKLSEWGIAGDQTKYIVLDAGRGDHVLVKSLLPRLKKKYPKIVAATCYKDIFNGEVEQISIAEAHQRLGNLDRFNVYRWCQEHNWTSELSGAYERMLEL